MLSLEVSLVFYVLGALPEQLHKAEGTHVHPAHVGAAAGPLLPPRMAIPLLRP